jgi:ribosomal-protein-alanine N-acetyltransferase
MPQSFRAAVREATSADIEIIIALGESAGDSVRWSRSHYIDALASEPQPRLLLVAEREGDQQGIVGFIMARVVGDEWEIENVAVSPPMQKKGLGGTLLASLVERARQARSARILLDVRASNAAAIALYEKHGFRQDGIRKDYYSNPTEDALLFSLSLGNSS